MLRRLAVVGVGAVGGRVAEFLSEQYPAAEIVITDVDIVRLRAVGARLGSRAIIEESPDVGRLIRRHGVDVVVVAAACGQHVSAARAAVHAGVSAISTSDRRAEVDALLAFGSVAHDRGATLLVGAGFSPGMTGLLAKYAERWFDIVDEVHIAKLGTGGPSCARQHHRALNGPALDWRDGQWRRRAGGSGRELVWFPEPIGGADCYRGALAEAVLLQPYFMEATRITARMAATRQDRFTAALPMLSPPHAEGGLGAVRVELRGRRAGSRVIEVLGATERPAEAAARVAAMAVELVGRGRAGGPGARGLAGVTSPSEALGLLAGAGLTAERFEGLHA